jgi:hypothetical protein
VSDYNYSGGVRVYDLQSTGELEAMLAAHLREVCAGKRSRVPAAGARIDELIEQLVQLQRAYEESDVNWESYERQRSEIFDQIQSTVAALSKE